MGEPGQAFHELEIYVLASTRPFISPINSPTPSTRRIDPARVFLLGFSIAGDLAWAIALRNPGKIRGAIVMSSRASYRQNSAYASRINGIKDAAALLKGQYCEIPKATHQAAPLPVLAEAVGFMLASPARQANPPMRRAP